MSKKLLFLASGFGLLLLTACASQSGYSGGVGYAGLYPYGLYDCYDADPYTIYGYGYSSGPCGYRYRYGYTNVYSSPPAIPLRERVAAVPRRSHPRVVARPDGPRSGSWSSAGTSGSTPSSSVEVARAPVAPVSVSSSPPVTHAVAPRQ